MRVAVDARHLGRGRGIARYVEAMLGELAARHPQAEWVAVGAQALPPSFPPAVHTVPAPGPARLRNAAAAALGRPRIDRTAGGADLVWIPAPAPVAWSASVPAVLTIHDISWEERPADFTAYERLWHTAARPRRLAARASRITCVSAATRDAAIASGWPMDRASVPVIPEAPMADQAVPASPGPGRHLLFVGALEPRKGIETLAQGLLRARARGLELPLVVVGRGRLEGLIAPLPGVKVVPDASRDELATLYEQATALVFPSLLEGFGLPPVEAAAFGVPTVASDLPALRESLGDAFLAVPAGDSRALGDAIFALATDLALRNRLGEEARDRVGRLSWGASADRLFNLFGEVLGGTAR